jgi:predicted porin
VRFNSIGDTVASRPNPRVYRGKANFNNAEINFKYQLTPALLIGAAFDYTKDSYVDSSTSVDLWASTRR